MGLFDGRWTRFRRAGATFICAAFLLNVLFVTQPFYYRPFQLSSQLESLASAPIEVDLTQYVQIFMGTEAGGNMFPGAARPFGTVKLGPDVYTGKDAFSGYLPTGNVTAFSMMHESGTGGAPKYGVVAQMPVLGSVPNPLVTLDTPRAAPDTGSVGYYQTNLVGGIRVELAATQHAGILTHTFPATSTEFSSIVIDVSHILPSFRPGGYGQYYGGGGIEVFADGHYEANGTYNGGWNYAPDWTIYSCGRFNVTPHQVRLFKGMGTTLQSYRPSQSVSSVSNRTRLGAVYHFPPGATLDSRIGISFISSSRACDHLEREVPSSIPQSQVIHDTKQVWNRQVLSKITTTETNITNLQLLYSSLYGMHLIASNRTGENPLWASTEPYYDDLISLWDLYRCTTPLLHILQPVAYEEQIRSLVDIWRHEGYMPDARSSNYNGRVQGGSSSDNVLADAYVKGVRGRINWTEAYQAMRTNAETTPANNYDHLANDSSTKEGRGALPDWIRYGYITPSFSRAVSRAIEYSTNDFALSQVAYGLGLHAEATTYLQRSRNWRNHWDTNATSLGFSGFVVPRWPNGSFVSQDPLSCGGCDWAAPYYQGLPWDYSHGMTHDIATLIDYTGGKEHFVKRLDMIFTPGQKPTGRHNWNHTIFDPSNEPDFAIPYLYHFAGREDLSVKRARFVARSYYAATAPGIPGNSDAGAMQSWLLWNMIGLYPLTSTTTFLIHAPWSPMTLDLGGGKKLRITTQGSNGDLDTAIYVQSLHVNGIPWKKNWLLWSDIFAAGGSMDFILGATPSTWFAGGPPPPSPASS